MERERKLYVRIKDSSIGAIMVSFVILLMSMNAKVNWHWPSAAVTAMIIGSLILFISGAVFLIFSVRIGNYLWMARERKVLMIEMEDRVKELEGLQGLNDESFLAIKEYIPWKRMLIQARVAKEDIPAIRQQIDSELETKKEILERLSISIPSKPWQYVFCQKLFRFKEGT